MNNPVNKDIKRELLLMTATIRPFVPTILTSEDERCRQYCATIERYIIESPFTDIVFAENSDYDFSVHANRFVEMAESYNKHFEYYNSVSLEHRGCIGEAEAALMKSALENSTILVNTLSGGGIWKVSGRLYIENCSFIVRKCKSKNCFLFSTFHPREWVTSYCFKAEREAFLNILLGNNAINNLSAGISMENVLCHCIYENNISVGRFPAFPRIKNRKNSGGGTYERNKLRYVLCDILLFCGFNSKRRNAL